MTFPKLTEPEWLFPFDGMDVGDSFFIPTTQPASLIYAVDTAAKKARIKVRAFTSQKEGHLGVRVWRVR